MSNFKSKEEIEKMLLCEIRSRPESVHFLPIRPGSHFETLIRGLAESLYHKQPTSFDFMPRTPYVERCIPDSFKECCKPEDLKWYDSGFSRYQYCTKCNKEIK